MFKRIFSTEYMKELKSIERLYKEGYKLVGCDYFYIWFKKVDVFGIKTNVALINRYIEEDLSVYSLVLQLDEHFKRIETHNP